MADERGGVDGTNADSLEFEQVERAQRYRLAERDATEAFDED